MNEKDMNDMITTRVRDRLTRWLLAGGVVGPLLFIVVLLIEGATRPGYNAWLTDGSYLELTDQGWEQIANFLVSGALVVGFAVGLGRTWRAGRASVWGPRLVGLFGLGLIAAGAFVTDPGQGYPPGAPLKGGPQTWHGMAHGINGLVVFTTLVVACFVLARRFAAEPGGQGWAAYSRLTGAAVLVLMVGGTVIGAFVENGVFSAPTGLLQRAMISAGWVWLAATALRLLRQGRPAIVDQSPTGAAPGEAVAAGPAAGGRLAPVQRNAG